MATPRGTRFGTPWEQMKDGFVFEFYSVCFPNKAQNSKHSNDSSLEFDPRFTKRLNKHDKSFRRHFIARRQI